MKYFILSLLLLFSLPGFSQSREIIDFNDNWEFKRCPFSSDHIAFNKTWDQKCSGVTIPHTWNNSDMQKRQNSFYEGEAYYKKNFTPYIDDTNKRFFIKFEGVGQDLFTTTL